MTKDPIFLATTEKSKLELITGHYETVAMLKARVAYLEKLLRPMNIVPDHVLETMAPLEKLVASSRIIAGWCAYCGEYPPIQGFFSCENCCEREPEGGPQ